ncbi:hypothetical protein ACFORH_21745 [Amycolatopsis roodepoortensis]|uniref:Uncharacterized protein n=1 Tax=Amycolatopsis roodepoortensis TaxID=700274 RepID=A0ABR9LEJ1_9PSEU|nr:hypothetical protein [Amycolatopsis roodepoortensis]MBE1579096.1 hypothetical protein [Amycolatopsis roodepoortensis]
MADVGAAVRKLLEQRNLFLKTEHDGREKIVYVCVDDGASGGLPVGHAIGTAGGVWLAYARVPQGNYYGNAQVAVGLPTCDAAVRAVLDHARYADILRSVERSSGRAARTYTAVVDPGHAEWLATLEEPKGITQLGKGKVRFTEAAVAYLRNPPPPLSLFVEVKGDHLILDYMTYDLTPDR